MFKFVIFSIILTIVQTSDIDAYLGKIKGVAIFPKLKTREQGICASYNVSLVDNECICGENVESTNAKLLHFKTDTPNVTITEWTYAISVVNTAAEAVEALAKYKTCKCGESVYAHLVYRPINDKFYIHYLKVSHVDAIITVLVSKYEAMKTEIEDIIHSIDELKTREYTLLCETNAN